MVGKTLALGGVALASMAMAPSSALANSSAAANVAVPVQSRDHSEIPAVGSADSDAKFTQLFATWKKSEKPAATAPGISAAAIPSRLPVDGARFSSLFGSRVHPISGRRKNHDGIDMAVPAGTPIYATADGRVEMAQWYGGYGNFVEIDHGGQMETRYGHMQNYNVREGQTVKKGDLIGWVGSTGRSTGPHLHYEVRIAGEAVDPQPYLHADTFQQAFAEANGLGAGGPE